MGIGGAPEGVITAAAMLCLNGEIFVRLMVTKPEHENVPRHGDSGFPEGLHVKGSRLGDHLIFAATGVPRHADERALLRRRRGTSSLVMQSEPARIRFIDTIHVEQAGMVKVRF